MKPPGAPASIKSNEEHHLTGLRLEQFHSPALEPYPYYEEVLRSDPGDSRANTALGILYLKRGVVALKAQDKLDDAFTMFHKAAWSAAWLGPSWYSLDEIAAARQDWHQSIEFLDRAIVANAQDARAKNLKAAVLRHLDRRSEANGLLAEVLVFDPLDGRALFGKDAKELASVLRDHPTTALDGSRVRQRGPLRGCDRAA